MPARMIAGIAVHALTASGAVLGLFALHAATAHRWQEAFLWLGAAAFVDAVDGPIARKIEVEKLLPRFSGARLDMVVDYLTYCAVPAFMIMESGRAGEGLGPVAGGLILLSSLFHFADIRSKTADGFFVGFPAIWNVVCLYFFVFDTGPAVTLAAVLVLSGLTFVPLKWVHPMRAKRRRGLTAAVTLIWSAAALYETLENFPGSATARVIFVAAAAYLLAVGLGRTFSLDGPKAGG